MVGDKADYESKKSLTSLSIEYKISANKKGNRKISRLEWKIL
jgi:hypothetical protein